MNQKPKDSNAMVGVHDRATQKVPERTNFPHIILRSLLSIITIVTIHICRTKIVKNKQWFKIHIPQST